MSYFAGDLKEATVNHPVEGSVVFQYKASEDNTFDLGGQRTTEVNVTGNGTAMRKINAVPWVVSGLIAWDMITAKDAQALCRMAASTLEGDWTFTNVNGSVYGGKGSPMGDIVGNVNQSTVPTTISGGGQLTKIA